jgi:multiple antibiotic resistance protein
VEALAIPLLKALALVPMTLLPIMNPLSTAPVFVATTGGSRSMSQRLARRVAINAWFVVVAAMLTGTYVLALFGISLPVVRIGGGLLVAATGWRMLHHSEDDDIHAAAAEKATTISDAQVFRQSFIPMTFPLTAGPGTIAAAIALGAQFPETPILFVAGAAVAAAGAVLVSLVIYFVFSRAAGVLAKLGQVGTLVMVRMMAFVLLCIGIQIVWTGWAELNGIAH